MESLPEEFPVWGLLPKKETGVTNFLTKHPEYNGDGVIIAIFDSGVDPGAPGLQTTPDGKMKVVERFDCSGCGDVDMTTVVQAKDNLITGLTGRKLKIPDEWISRNPSKNFRIGVKNSFNLYPEKLRERIQEENKEKNWTNQHKMAVADASRNLATLENKPNGGSDEDKPEKENLEAIVEYLNNYDKKYSDLGVFYDCVMFNDGQLWHACIDTTEEGDLEQCGLIGEYSKTHEFKTLNKADQLNYSINVHNDGSVLEIVGLCSSHGTHVASIASAYFPDEPEKNGVAPGARIVSLTIGDCRLGSMETGTALVRAMIKVMELQKTDDKIDVINMSYGEHAHWSNTGRVGELMNEIVNKYGVVWVASAGNHGPALSTIGTPPDISQETVIGVGAYVSPDMMVAEYAMRTKLKGMSYTWSSRGPTIDGGMGVTVCAPGGAITSVPNFTLRNSQLMNGTSMAAPHVAGAVSILLSGLKQLKLTYSPYQVKRALENGATYMNDVEPFSQGSGLLNVEKTFDLLVKYNDVPEKEVRFHVSCGPHNGKGVYIRNLLQYTSLDCSVSVEPFFSESRTVPAETKIALDLRLSLVCKDSWVKHPKHLNITNISRVFGITLETEGLKPVNFTTIEAYDTKCIEKGPVFKVPITVIKPQEVKAPQYSISEKNVFFEANTIKRIFVSVPDLATWAVIKMRSCDANVVGKFVVHCMHILPKQNCKSLELNKHLTVTSNNESILSFQVKGLNTIEIVLAKYWASISKINIDYTISFYGTKPNQNAITMMAVDGVHIVEVNCLQGEEVLPNVLLKNSVQILRSTDSKISPLSARDVIPPGRQIYELCLTYNFHLNKATEVSPNCPLLSDVLYESEFESQLWMLYDSNKQLLFCGDAYPSKYNTKLEKGDYVIKLQVRHDRRDYLDKLTDCSLLLNQKLSSNINLDVYTSYTQAVISGKKSAVGYLLNTTAFPLYIAPLAADKFVAKNNNAAHYLTGTITYAKDEIGKKVDHYPIKYVLCDNKKPVLTKTPEKTKTKAEEYKDALRELKVSWLSKFDKMMSPEKFYKELLQEFPDFLPIHSAYLQSVEPMDPKKQLPIFTKEELSEEEEEELTKNIETCEKVIKEINQDALLMHLSIKNDQRDDATQIKQNMDRQKIVLMDTLCRLGILLCRVYINGDESKMTNITETWKNLLQYCEPSDPKMASMNVLCFACWYSVVNKHWGKVLKYLTKINEEKPCKEAEEKLLQVYKICNWNHMVRHAVRQGIGKYPASYKPF